jgi:hypothetical protein
MAQINSIYYNSPGKQLLIDNDTNQFIISGYRVVVDPNLNRDLLIVNAPTSTGDIGQKGNIAFDKNHLYYCIDTNRWVRSKLANWGPRDGTYAGAASDGVIDPVHVGVTLPTPTNWWPFLSSPAASLGSYEFTAYGAKVFNSNGYSNAGGGYLLNYTSNLVEPSTLNQSFTLSFEVKRTSSSQFFMGSPFGKLGFHMQFIDGAKGSRGEFITYGDRMGFVISAHRSTFFAPAVVDGYNDYRWFGVCSNSAISMNEHSQIVAVNDAPAQEIRLYVNGVHQQTISYAAATPLKSRYNNPLFQGWAIGASPNGSSNANTEYNSPNILRQMGFWKGYALDQTEITALYNEGNFQRYPFV